MATAPEQAPKRSGKYTRNSAEKKSAGDIKNRIVDMQHKRQSGNSSPSMVEVKVTSSSKPKAIPQLKETALKNAGILKPMR